MADWKSQISYNYNPAYHAYAYSLVYQPGTEQTHGNMSGWGNAGVADLNNYNTGMTQAYYATASSSTGEESPPRSPEPQVVNGHCHYQGSGAVYYSDAQAGRLLLAAPARTAYEAREHELEVRRAGSDSTSDSEAHVSPDSWSSGSSREGCLPQADPTTWVKKDLDAETRSSSPDASEDVSSPVTEEPRTFAVLQSESTENIAEHVPVIAPKKQSTIVNNPKAKARAAFSDSQMNILVQQFSVQRYLPPAEMKNLAEKTGLTYKQVKTWFQNRRMKLRRHQKDTSWVSERYTTQYTNKSSPVRGPIFSNIPSHIPPYQGEVQPQLKEHYNQHVMKAAFKKTTPQNLAFYLATMGSAARPTGYPSWSSGPAQTAVPNRPQTTAWSMPPGVTHYDYNPSVYSSANNTAQDASKAGEPVASRGPLSTILHDVSQ
ncbi:uncharacterized protein V6R79_018207 [Siganus canaliculatus]